MKVSILGCGWFGLSLARHLLARGHKVSGSTTTRAKISVMKAAGLDPVLLDFCRFRIDKHSSLPFFDCETLVISIPVRYNEDYDKTILSLLETVRLTRIPNILFISSIRVYGNQNKVLTELSPACPTDSTGELLLSAETALRSEADVNTNCLRFGGLVGPHRHPSTFLKGLDHMPNGLAPVNLVHLDDCIAIATQLIEGRYQQLVINAVTPHHPSRELLYRAAAIAAGLQPPRFLNEKKQWKMIRSIYLDPLLSYDFKVTNWYRWLATAPID